MVGHDVLLVYIGDDPARHRQSIPNSRDIERLIEVSPKKFSGLSRGKHELVACDPDLAFAAANLFEHDGEIFDIGAYRGVVLEEQSRDELMMVWVSDDEMNMPRNAAGISGVYRNHLERSAIIRVQCGTPAIRFVVTVLVGVQDLNPCSRDSLAASIQYASVHKQGLAIIALSPEIGLGGGSRIVVRSRAGSGGRCPSVACGR